MSQLLETFHSNWVFSHFFLVPLKNVISMKLNLLFSLFVRVCVPPLMLVLVRIIHTFWLLIFIVCAIFCFIYSSYNLLQCRITMFLCISLFELGLQPQLANLYPPVQYPVSRGTPMISPLVCWEHSEDRYVMKYLAEVTLWFSFENYLCYLTINSRAQPDDGHHDVPKHVVASSIASYIIKLVVLTIIHLFTSMLSSLQRPVTWNCSDKCFLLILGIIWNTCAGCAWFIGTECWN